MVKLGIIGLSEGNGHPYSFSAIINGFDEAEFATAGWPGILAYLKKKDPADIASINAKVEYVWTQDKALSRKIADSCQIPNVVSHYREFIGNVDAVIIARDDYETHYEMAKEFLEKGIAVFIDKPLTLDLSELAYFKPYIESGLLMSCSGFRYCVELDPWRQDIGQFGAVKLTQAAVINGWNKYGIHMVDAILSLDYAEPQYIEPVICSEHESVNIVMTDGSLCQINALGSQVVTFSVGIYGTNKSESVQIRDNFSAFRRTLFRFVEQVRTGQPAIKPASTLLSIKTLIAGRMALDSGKRIYLKDLGI